MINREEHKIKILSFGEILGNVIVLGGGGSIGEAIAPLKGRCTVYHNTDINKSDEEFLDITDEYAVRQAMGKFKPEIIINLAGAKHAPEGEDTTFHTLEVNTIGVQNLIKWKPKGCRIIQASTCKACNPETAYGASKLLAERMVLNSGGTIVRYYNVIETHGNVFEIWKQQEKTGTIKVTKCERYFITLSEAAGLTIAAINLPPGRYGINSVKLVNMIDVAKHLYPNLKHEIIEPRRGDRLTEKLLGTNEVFGRTYHNDAIVQIINYNDAN